MSANLKVNIKCVLQETRDNNPPYTEDYHKQLKWSMHDLKNTDFNFSTWTRAKVLSKIVLLLFEKGKALTKVLYLGKKPNGNPFFI